MSEGPPPHRIASEGSRIHSESLRDQSGPVILQHDYTSSETNLEALDKQMLGNTAILSPNDIRIERIPFATEYSVRSQI